MFKRDEGIRWFYLNPKMKYAVIINTKEAETVWNALRFGAAAISRDHHVTTFLMGPAVEIESIGNEKFDVKKAWTRYLEFGGEALSCGTCLQIRQMSSNESCPVSTMDELVRLTEQADKTIVFG